MLKPLRVLLPILALILLLPGTRPAAAQCVSLTTLGVPYLQDFNTLASAGTSSRTSTMWW